LAKRYNDQVSTIMAVFWLLVYVFVNLTSIIYLGAIAITSISMISFTWCIIGLIVFSLILTLGGMNVIGYTDVIQVLVLVIGGLMTTYLSLKLLSDHFGHGENALTGLFLLREKADSHFHMIFGESHAYYKDLPGLSVLIGGMWINNLNYWGCNQYITQRALGADLKTARNGILFAAFLKLLIPVIAVLPGIAMYILYKEGMFQQEMVDEAGVLKPDHAYPTLLNLLPPGFKGIAFAALTAAIVASLAGKANSISTIFSFDIYRKFIKKNVSVYSGVCWLYFTWCTGDFFNGLPVEKNNDNGRADRGDSDNTGVNGLEVFAGVDKWIISGLPVSGSNEYHICVYYTCDDCDQSE
jgi:solute:Na+ symporter, SSS family